MRSNGDWRQIFSGVERRHLANDPRDDPTDADILVEGEFPAVLEHAGRTTVEVEVESAGPLHQSVVCLDAAVAIDLRRLRAVGGVIDVP